MTLTEEQESVLGGERGDLLARYLEWSILWGEALGATRLVPVTNVHCPGALGHERPRNYVSDSFKQSFYGRSALASRTGVLPLEGCIAAAVSGRWAG